MGGSDNGGASPSMDDLLKRLTGMRVSSSAPPPPPHFSKRDLLRRHNSVVASMRALDSDTRLYKTYLNIQGDRNPPAASLGDPASLALCKPILIRQLQLDKVHRNRVLFATLVSDPFQASSVITVLEDQDGYATTVSLSFSSARESAYPSGAKVAIKDPYFKTAMDGSTCIRVNDPEHIVRLSDASMAVALRLQGNNLFAAGAYSDAADRYTACVNGCLDVLTRDGDVASVREVLLMALSNRAEVHVRMGQFAKAVADADAALEIDAAHVKSLYRKGRSLICLGRYDEACVALEKAVKLDPDKVEAQDSLNEARDKARRSTTTT